MKTPEGNVTRTEPRFENGLAASRIEREGLAEAQYEHWMHLHVNRTAVGLGALATFCMVVLFGLVGIALQAHLLGPEHRLVDLKKLGLWSVAFCVFGAFLSSVIGGWVAVKIAGILHAEPAMLHGSFVWLVTVPILVVCAGLGASSLLGGWYGSLVPNSATNPSSVFVPPDPLAATATPDEIAAFKLKQAEYNRNVRQWNEDTPKVTRNSALVALTALLLGLLGSVIGGWLASGEPMDFVHYRTRKPLYHIA